MMLLEYLKTISLVTVPFAIYFAWTKIGHRVAASYSWRAGPLIAPGIGSVTLINMKDRPIAIFDIHAVMGDLSFHLKEFSPPLILKAMEAVTVETDIVSQRYLGSDEYEWNGLPGMRPDIDIFLSTSSKTVRCRRQGPPSRMGFVIRRKLLPVTNHTERFNGLIYNKNAKYAVTYTENKQQKTALIDSHGSIYWDLVPNGLRPEHIRSVETVRAAFIACGLATIISPFAIDELNKQDKAPVPSKTGNVPPVTIL